MCLVAGVVEYIDNAAAFYFHVVVNRQAFVEIFIPGFLHGGLQDGGHGACGYAVGGGEAAAVENIE